VSFGEQQFGPIGQVRAGKFAEQLIDVADGFRMFLHAEHGRGHQQVGVVEEVGRGTAFDEASQHDRCGFRLFRVDQTFGLVEHGLAGGSRWFRLLCAGRRWILFGGAASPSVTRPARNATARATLHARRCGARGTDRGTIDSCAWRTLSPQVRLL
jgi:hypothetical protein